MNNRLINAGLILVAYLLTCIAIWTGPYFQSGLTYTVGDVSRIRVVATRDVENVVATEKNRAEAAARADTMDPTTVLDPSISVEVYTSIVNYFDGLDTLRANYDEWEAEQEQLSQEAFKAWEQQQIEWSREYEEWLQEVEEGEGDPGEAPIQPEGEYTFQRQPFPIEERFNALGVPLTALQRDFLFDLPPSNQTELYRALTLTAEFILEPGISEFDSRVSHLVETKLHELMDNIDAIRIGHVVLSNLLVPNRVFNEAAHQVAWENLAQDYQKVILRQFQTIVDDGEIITEEHYAMMQALGLINAGWTHDIVPLFGIFILVAITMLTCCWYIYFYRKRIISHIKEATLLFTLYVVVLSVMWSVGNVGYYFMPILLFTTLIAMLVDLRAAIVFNLGFTIIGYFVIDGSIQYMLFFALAGSLTCLLARYTTDRNKIMIVSLLSACINFTLSVSISMAFEHYQTPNELIIVGAFAALNGVLTIIIAVGSLPLWEVIFGVVTPIKLLDLTNPTNPLMRRLTIEAPGTYHHSLIVANLAESAAYDIGANPHMSRAGGYYHDIGKLKYPHYFAENITGVNPHDKMKPISSAQIIMSHVAYGLNLASEYRLPLFIRDIIQEHHGTSVIKYFYSKAKDLEKESDEKSEVKEEDYRYPYLIPQSRESAVVMLADGIEAAVRSIMAQANHNTDLNSLIKKMIKDKLSDGSLADSHLSIRDVDTIGQSFYRVLKGMYHERIPYPEDNKEEDKAEPEDEKSKK